MTEFDDLIEAKDKAYAHFEECSVAEDAATIASQLAHEKFVEATAALEAAHQAVHDVLAEKGEHYGIDQETGTVTVYKPIDESPGWCAVHPIPGRTKAKKAK